MKSENGQIDVFVGPDIKSTKVFIIDQKDLHTGKFDEHKVMIGFPLRAVALANYRMAFSDGRGKDRIGGITEMSIDEFKAWLKDGDTSKPLSRMSRADGGRTEAPEPWRDQSPDGQAMHLAGLADRIKASQDEAAAA